MRVFATFFCLLAVTNLWSGDLDQYNPEFTLRLSAGRVPPILLLGELFEEEATETTTYYASPGIDFRIHRYFNVRLAGQVTWAKNEDRFQAFKRLQVELNPTIPFSAKWRVETRNRIERLVFEDRASRFRYRNRYRIIWRPGRRTEIAEWFAMHEIFHDREAPFEVTNHLIAPIGMTFRLRPKAFIAVYATIFTSELTDTREYGIGSLFVFSR